VIQHDPPAKKTTTEEIGALIDEIESKSEPPDSEEAH
jgi:hypothetical protein